MAHRRGSFRRGVSDSQKRRKTWIPLLADTTGPFFGQLTAPAAAGSTKDIFFGSFAPGLQESTILRTRAEFTFDPKAVSSILSEGAVFAVGMGIITNEAAAAGPAAVPNPAGTTGAFWDGWFVHETYSWNTLLATGFVENRHQVIDSKAMRKVPTGMGLVIAFGLAVSGAGITGDLSYSLAGRNLFMLP